MLHREYPVMNKSDPALMRFAVHWGRYIIKNKYSMTKLNSAMENTNGEIIIKNNKSE